MRVYGARKHNTPRNIDRFLSNRRMARFDNGSDTTFADADIDFSQPDPRKHRLASGKAQVVRRAPRTGHPLSSQPRTMHDKGVTAA